MDLSAAASATLSFNVRTDTGVDATDSVVAEISSNGGGTWTTLVDVTGITGAQSGPVSFDISAYATANTQIRYF